MEIFIQILRPKVMEYIQRLNSLERQLRQSYSPDEIHQITQSVEPIYQESSIILQIFEEFFQPDYRDPMKYGA